MKSNVIINTLNEAGKYEDIKNILKSIIMEPHKSYPVRMYLDNDGHVNSSVEGSDVREQAARLLVFLDSEMEVDRSDFKFEDLFRLILSTTNDLLHNYAVDVSHRSIPTIDMEKIRSYEVLQNMLDCFWDDDNEGWTIPDGWKAEKKG